MPVPISPSFSCHYCLWLPRETSALLRKTPSVLCVSVVLKHPRKMEKPTEFTQDAFMFVRKPNGPFFSWGAELGSQPQLAFFFPSCTYSIFPLLILSRQEHSVATQKGREGGKPGAKSILVRACLGAETEGHSPLPPHFMGDHACNKPVSENEGALFLFEYTALRLGLCWLMTCPWEMPLAEAALQVAWQDLSQFP